MSGSSSSQQPVQTTTQSSSSAPWGAAQPALKLGLAGATSLYNAGTGAEVYRGSTVTPYSQPSLDAFADIEQKSNDAQGYMGGFTEALQPYASGQNLDGRNNPAFARVLQQTQEDTMNAINMQAAAAGRYGSPTHTGTAVDAMGDVTSRALSANYNQEVTNMFNAGNMLPSAFTASLAPSQSLLGVGAAQEDLAGREMQDQLRIFDAEQSLPWEQLGRLNAIASGAGSMGGTTTGSQSQTTTGGGNKWGSAFGNALSGYAYGGTAGALLGGASGYFS